MTSSLTASTLFYTFFYYTFCATLTYAQYIDGMFYRHAKGFAAVAAAIHMVLYLKVDYCQRRVYPNGTHYYVDGVPCAWYWQYATFFDVGQMLFAGAGGLCMWARAYHLYRRRVVPAHKAFKYGCVCAGSSAVLLAVSSLSLPGMYASGGQ